MLLRTGNLRIGCTDGEVLGGVEGSLKRALNGPPVGPFTLNKSNSYQYVSALLKVPQPIWPRVLRPQPEWLRLQPPLAARLMASLWLPKFPPVGSPVSLPNFDCIPFELNLALPLALPNSAKLQSWSDLCQLDEINLGPRLKKNTDHF